MEDTQTAVRRPSDFEDSDETIMSNFDHIVDNEVAEKIKGQKLFAGYAAWDFFGYVW